MKQYFFLGLFVIFQSAKKNILYIYPATAVAILPIQPSVKQKIILPQFYIYLFLSRYQRVYRKLAFEKSLFQVPKAHIWNNGLGKEMSESQLSTNRSCNNSLSFMFQYSLNVCHNVITAVPYIGWEAFGLHKIIGLQDSGLKWSAA